MVLPGPGGRAERGRAGPRRRLRGYGADHAQRWRARAAQVEATEPFQPLVDGKPHVDAGGFAFRPDETELRDAFNVELHKMKKQRRTPPHPAAVRLHQGRDDRPDREGAVRRMTTGLWETGSFRGSGSPSS